MEDNGRFPGLMKLDGEGGMPKAFVMLGEEKSSISSLNNIPVRFPVTPEPNLQFRKLSEYHKMNLRMIKQIFSFSTVIYRIIIERSSVVV
jgi:hypothetical protein